MQLCCGVTDSRCQYGQLEFVSVGLTNTQKEHCPEFSDKTSILRKIKSHPIKVLRHLLKGGVHKAERQQPFPPKRHADLFLYADL